MTDKPLRFTTTIAKRGKSSELPLAFDHWRKASAIPLPLTRKIADRPASNALPFEFARRLRHVFDGEVVIIEPPKPKRVMSLGACFSATLKATNIVAICAETAIKGDDVGRCVPSSFEPVYPVGACSQSQTDTLIGMARCQNAPALNNLAPLGVCSMAKIDRLFMRQQCRLGEITRLSELTSCNQSTIEVLHYLYRCREGEISRTVEYQQCGHSEIKGASTGTCNPSRLQRAVDIPCRFYPIPEPPPSPPADNYACGIRPSANAIPLAFKRKRIDHDPAQIPLTFSCNPVHFIPHRKGYIMHNTIELTIDDVPMQALSASVSTDMSAYCWQCNIKLAPDDFKRINLNKPRGQEPVIKLTINNQLFVFILEDYSETQQFISNHYTITGRSVSARLGEDYAQVNTGLLDQYLYARQIVNAQLANLPISIDQWQIVDWLVHAGTYDTSNKTPIAVIADVARVAGGFVETHPSLPRLNIKNRWIKPVWELNTGEPSATIPPSVIIQITGQKRTSTRANAIRLLSPTQGGHVYRRQEDRSREASAVEHPLYCDSRVMLPAGIALLSETGVHQTKTLQMIWSEQYGVSLAKIGDLWQVNRGTSNWRGIVQGVSVELSHDNQAPTVIQTVRLDRYLDT